MLQGGTLWSILAALAWLSTSSLVRPTGRRLYLSLFSWKGNVELLGHDLNLHTVLRMLAEMSIYMQNPRRLWPCITAPRRSDVVAVRLKGKIEDNCAGKACRGQSLTETLITFVDPHTRVPGYLRSTVQVVKTFAMINEGVVDGWMPFAGVFFTEYSI